MKLGVVGLPNVGKSTLFNAITRAGAEVANYPFCTIEANVGVVAVPDCRLDALAKLYDSKKITPALLKFVDIAGLVKGASRGEGLGNKFLSHIREVDAIVHVVRCFEGGNVTHVNDKIDPLSDIETVNTELILADIDTAVSRLDKAKSMIKTGDKKYLFQAELYQKILDGLNEGIPARALKLSEEEKAEAEQLLLLSAKPVIYCANIGEEDIGKTENNYVKSVRALAQKEGVNVLPLCAKVEEELTHLDEGERQLFLEGYGLSLSGLERLVQEGYELLGLISYLTAGEKETRAWTIERGTKAPQAAGKIHSDFERGFIRAEVVPYKTLIECGNYHNAKEQGKVRSEGKDYEIKDGDVVLFRFNV